MRGSQKLAENRWVRARKPVSQPACIPGSTGTFRALPLRSFANTRCLRRIAEAFSAAIHHRHPAGEYGEAPEHRALFGDDRFTFWSGGLKGIVLNSTLYSDPTGAPAEQEAQETWYRALNDAITEHHRAAGLADAGALTGLSAERADRPGVDTLAGVPVVTTHRDSPYLFAWLGLREVATLEPRPGLPPSAGHLEKVLGVVKKVAKSNTTVLVRGETGTGKGLEGDRYYSQLGTFSKEPGSGRELTLIEAEAIEALRRELDVEYGLGDSRRNVVTRGVPLNHLVGKEFWVGEVKARGIMLCEPCAHLQKLTIKQVLPGLLHRAGLRAQILTEGTIRVGAAVTEPRP